MYPPTSPDDRHAAPQSVSSAVKLVIRVSVYESSAADGGGLDLVVRTPEHMLAAGSREEVHKQAPASRHSEQRAEPELVLLQWGRVDSGHCGHSSSAAPDCLRTSRQYLEKIDPKMLPYGHDG